jgi:hypothetical protein
MTLDRRNRDTALALQALSLLGRWDRIAGLHIAAGMSCVCRGVFPGIRAADFEEEVLAWMAGRYPDATHAELAGPGGVAAMLRGLARGSPGMTAGARAAMLADWERIIESFERSHAGSGPAGGQAPSEGPRLP